jgi:hypothetical protein
MIDKESSEVKMFQQFVFLSINESIIYQETFSLFIYKSYPIFHSLKKIKSVAYSKQGSHTDQLDFCK